MVAFLTAWPLINRLVRSWQRLSGRSALNSSGEETIAFVPDTQGVHAKDDDLLFLRMRALGLDTTEVAQFRPGIILDLHQTCVACDSRKQCHADLKFANPEDDNSDAQPWRDYCPNIAILNLLSSLVPAMRETAH